MNQPGEPTLSVLIEARRALLDACDALRRHLDVIVLVGAQAIYMHTAEASVALAEFTRDSDLALDVRGLSDSPRLEEAMAAAGLQLAQLNPQPGAWFNGRGIEVDLMVPEALAGAVSARSRGRGVDIPPHGRTAARRAVGLEAALIDHHPRLVRALDSADERSYTMNVAGPAALLVAKLHKVAERLGDVGRSRDKDAHDLYRLLVAVMTEPLAASMRRLRADPLSADVTQTALAHLAALFADGATAEGSIMAGRAEEAVGNPDTVTAAVSALAADLLAALDPPGAAGSFLATTS